MKRKEKQKVLVAMSGGVDSSVAAALLVRAGFDVTGMFAVNFESDGLHSVALRSDAESCWRGDYQDALRVAAKLGIPLVRWNFVKEYKKTVLDYMFREYRAGRTPNPDVLCNKFVKFGSWLQKAKKSGFDYIATGHYAVVKASKHKTIQLATAKDDNKDQTYFLHQLNQSQLKHVLFPIGGYTKPQVRALAKKFGLPTAVKEESMGICFVGEVPMKKFLMKKIKINKGKIVNSAGEIVGEHDGLAFYTIGERMAINCHSEGAKRPKNLSASLQKILPRRLSGQDDDTRPVYVVGKNIKKNELIVGYENDSMLYVKEIKVKNINWIAGRAPKFPLKCEVRLRHRQPLQKCIVQRGKIIFRLPQRAVTPGQFAVFYLKGVCLGGGVIK